VVESFGDRCSIERFSFGGCKDKIRLDPSSPSDTSLLILSNPVSLKVRRDHEWHSKSATASWCLWFHQLRRAVHPLQLTSYTQIAQINVDITPAKTKRLTLAKAHRQCHGVQGFEAIPLDIRKERASPHPELAA
jgi:hypothetical protein